MATARTSLRRAVKPGTPSFLQRHKFFLLFMYLLFALAIYPYLQNGSLGYLVFRIVGSAGIFLSLYVISLRRMLLICALVLSIPALVQRILLPRVDEGFLALLAVVLSFAFDVFVVVMIFRRVFTKEQPNSETIFGALCIYLLVGFCFASVYAMIATMEPRAFYLDPLANLHSVPDRFDFVYYSFATMTSLGATGMTAASREVRSVSVIEAILGVLYLAVMIARLMGAYRHPSLAARD
ncbi:MAG TPA: hypothetical protein VKV05_13555 [Terriglobales bacterium]|nr:hypothetical protein [Terriglobales bacterium]